MIIDTLKNAYKYYGLNPRLEKAFAFIKNEDLESLKEGEYEIDGKDIVALVQEYTTSPNPPWEAHKYHIDIQYLVSGVEKIGYRQLDGMIPTEYRTKTDCFLYDPDYEGDYLTLKDDTIMIIFPDDGHVPRVAYDQPMAVKKIVIKVLI
jgi:YhcH/YjgK/YiaL family protein